MLLPKENRDLLEVIVGFIRLVASFADGEGGNKMDTSNLAVVFAPNILYSKVGKEKPERTVAVKDESFLAIEVIKAIVQHQDLLWQV